MSTTPSQTPPPKIYLASKSPRRQDLLRQLCVDFELLLPEDSSAAEALEASLPGERPSAYVQRVALAKMQAAQVALVKRGLVQRPILSSDTTVALGSKILGKPANEKEASDMLQALSGQTHRVLTAVAVSNGRKIELKLSASRVRFARLSKAQVAQYVQSREGFDKAGGYAIQGLAARFIRDIQGSYSGIMGLPLYETAQLLKL